MTDNSFLTELEEIFHCALLEQIENGNLDEDQITEAIEPAFTEIRSEIASMLLKALRRDAPKMLRDQRSQLAGFEKRNFRRWRKAFDLFEMMVVMAGELGDFNNKALRPQAQEESDYKFEALAQLHPRAVLVSREILCLLKGGFPDGALARWRSLHELTVTAMFIAKQDQTIALNYLASFTFRSMRAAKQYNEHAERAKVEPFLDDDLTDLKDACDAVEQQIGRRLKKDYDWAYPAITAQKISFTDLEKNVEMEHWRPRYRWASQHTHAGHRPAERLLGLVESESPLMLIGPSNSGFTDPLQMAAISLMQMTMTFLLHKPNLDRFVYAEMMLQLADQLGPLALKIERETLAADRSKSHAT